MAYYQSVQAVRFRSSNDRERFYMLFKEAIKAASQVPGFISITWWTHPEDPDLFLETSIWDSKEAPDGCAISLPNSSGRRHGRRQ